MVEGAPVEAAKPPGQIYTFYSYKGGVGRTMALVNTGVLMALERRKVLLIDWDLEAPGLEMFFSGKQDITVSAKPSEVPGVVDLLEARAAGESLPWQKCLIKVTFGTSSLDIISPGRASNDYPQRVQQLNWGELFAKHAIGNYLDQLRSEWRTAYDFVLIDSRTGITDIGDICTVLLPDTIVAVSVSNRQNIDGVKKAIGRAKAAHAKLPVNRNLLMVVPLRSRDESKTEYEAAGRWNGIFADEIGPLFKEWLPKEIAVAEAVAKLFIPYVTFWSYGERIPVLENPRELHDPGTISSAFARLSTLLTKHLDWYAVYKEADVAELKADDCDPGSKKLLVSNRRDRRACCRATL